MNLKCDAINFMKVSCVLLCAVGFTGCKSTPEGNMPIPPTFAQQAQLYPVYRPMVTIKDDAYHQNIGVFRIENMDLSGKSMEKVSRGTGWQTSSAGGLLFQMLFHDSVNTRGDLVNEFSSRGEQSFSFDVAAPGLAPVHAECQIAVFGVGEETLDNGENSYNWQTSEQTASYLGCKLTQQGQVSELTIERKSGAEPSFRLHQGTSAVQITPVHAGTMLSHYNPEFRREETGYLFTQHAGVQSALQLSLDHSRLWLGSAVAPTQQQWLLAVMFSMQMYHWQDNYWPSLTDS